LEEKSTAFDAIQAKYQALVESTAASRREIELKEQALQRDKSHFAASQLYQEKRLLAKQRMANQRQELMCHETKKHDNVLKQPQGQPPRLPGYDSAAVLRNEAAAMTMKPVPSHSAMWPYHNVMSPVRAALVHPFLYEPSPDYDVPKLTQWLAAWDKIQPMQPIDCIGNNDSYN
jgi:hypothetical protein